MSGKKKRQSSNDLVFIEVEIFNNPSSSLNDTSSIDAINSQMSDLSNTITNQYLTGKLQKAAASVLNVTMMSMAVIPANTRYN